MNKDAAETLAIQAVAHIAGDEELLQGLLAQTGMGLMTCVRALRQTKCSLACLTFYCRTSHF